MQTQPLMFTLIRHDVLGSTFTATGCGDACAQSICRLRMAKVDPKFVYSKSYALKIKILDDLIKLIRIISLVFHDL
jgi:hypothetical protein